MTLLTGPGTDGGVPDSRGTFITTLISSRHSKRFPSNLVCLLVPKVALDDTT